MEARPGSWAPSRPPVILSPDSGYWWDGSFWWPTLSADGRWRFDGHGWLPVARKPRPRFFDVPRWVKIGGVAWLGALWLFVTAPVAASLGSGSDSIWLACAGCAMILLTVAWSFLLGRQRLVLWALVVAASLGWAAQVFYVGAMINQSPPDDLASDAAAIGLIVIGVPVSIALWIVVAACFGLGLLSRRLIRLPARG